MCSAENAWKQMMLRWLDTSTVELGLFLYLIDRSRQGTRFSRKIMSAESAFDCDPGLKLPLFMSRNPLEPPKVSSSSLPCTCDVPMIEIRSTASSFACSFAIASVEKRCLIQNEFVLVCASKDLRNMALLKQEGWSKCLEHPSTVAHNNLDWALQS